MNEVLRQLERAPKTVPAQDPGTGKEVQLVVTRAMFAQAIRYMLYRPSSASRVPLMIDAASRGDFSELGSFALTLGAAFNGMPDGIYVAVTCAEDVGFIDEPTARLLAAGTFLGTSRLDIQRQVCASWPKGHLASGYRGEVKSSAPTLLLVGERDPATPPRLAYAVAENLPNGRVVVVNDGGHSFDGLRGADCVSDLAAKVIRDASTDAIQANCAGTAQHPPFVLKSASESVVAMSPEQLSKFGGTYAGGDGMLLNIRVSEKTIAASIGETTLHFAPVGPSEFADVGGLGIRLVFEISEGRAAALRLIEGSGDGVRLVRKE